MSSCKSCGARIIWAITRSGKRMPLDEMCTRVWIVEGRDGEIHTRPIDGHKPHFATCPNADQHRKKR